MGVSTVAGRGRSGRIVAIRTHDGSIDEGVASAEMANVDEVLNEAGVELRAAQKLQAGQTDGSDRNEGEAAALSGCNSVEEDTALGFC